MSLHPATRRLLQGEVARVYGGRDPDSQKVQESSWSMARLWPGLGWALAVVAGLLVAGSLMLPQHPTKNYELAMSSPERSFANKVSPAPVAAPAETRSRAEAQNTPATAKETLADSEGNRRQPEPQPLLAYDALGRKSKMENPGAAVDKDSVLRDEAKVAAAASPPPANASGVALQKKADDFRSDFAGAPAAEKPALALTTSPSAASLTTQQAGLESDKNPIALAPRSTAGARSNAAHRFVQAPSASGGLLDKAVAPVLTAFDFEQSGSQIRVVDADGSVYVGTLRTPATAQAALAQSEESGRPLADASMKFNRLVATSTPADYKSEAATELSFQVEGTNQTLKQKVVLTGALFTKGQTTDRPQTVVVTNTVITTRAQKSMLLGQPAPATPVSRISGKAIVGGATFDINAVQAP